MSSSADVGSCSRDHYRVAASASASASASVAVIVFGDLGLAPDGVTAGECTQITRQNLSLLARAETTTETK